MAKTKVAPPEDLDDEVSTTSDRSERVRPSRLGWFISRLVVMLLLLGVLVFFLPAIISQPAVWKAGLGFAAPELKDRIHIDSLSLGWLSDIRIKGLILKDDKGSVLAQVAEVASVKPLYALALNSNQLGKFRVLDPKASVVLRADGSNWEDFLKLLPKSEGEPTGPGQPIQFQLELLRGEVTLDDQIAGKQWLVAGINADVDWPADANLPRTGKLSAGIQPAGQLPVAVATGDLQAEFAWQPTAAGLGSGKVLLKANSLALDISQGALRRAGVDIQAAGALSTDLQYDFASDAQDHQLNLKQLSAPNLQVASATYLSTDRPLVSIQSGQGQMQFAGGKLTVLGLDIRTSLLQIAGSGQAVVDELKAATAGGAIAGDSQLQLQGQLDLAAIAAQLPATLHLKNDTRITSGRVNLGLASRNEPTGRIWQVLVQTDNLVAEAAGRQVRWDEPLKLEGTARQSAAGITIEQLVGKASFFELNGSGALAKGEITASADLNRLVAELDQFVDFGDTRLAGNLSAKLNWQQTQGEQWQATAATSVQQFALEAPGVVPWREENLQVGLQVGGRISGTSLEEISSATLSVLSSADQLDANLTKPVTEPSMATAWPLQFKLKGDLATWQPRVQAFVPLAGWRTAGGIDLQGAGTFSLQTAELQTGKLVLSKLSLSGPGLAMSEPQVVLETSGTWDQQNLTFTSTSTTLASSAVALRAENVKAVLSGGTPTVQGVVDYRGDLARLMTWIPSAEPPTYQVTGMLEGRLEAALRNGKVEAVWSNDIKNLTYATPDAPVAGARPATLVSGSTAGPFVVRRTEQLVKVGAQASYDPATDVLVLTTAQLQSSAASFNADGTINQLTKNCVADIKGNIAYDWAVLTREAAQYGYIPGANNTTTKASPLLTPELTGQETRPFAIRGPLIGSAGDGGLVSSELGAQVEIGWKTARYMGLDMGQGAIPAKLEKSIVFVGPLDLTVNEGKVLGAPRLNLTSSTPVLEMDKGPVIQNLRISPELCDGWMKFVAPMLAGVTRAEGKFSIDLDGAKVPLTQTMQSSIGGVMTIHTAEVGPGPLSQQYINLAKQLKDIAEGNYAGIANLFPGAAGAALTETANSPTRGVLTMPEQQVKFELIDGRVHHHGLKMNVSNVTITTRGSVGLDQTMEIVADVPIQDSWLKQNSALAGLKGQSLQIPIRGTLAAPSPDLRVIANLTKDLAGRAATGIFQDKAGEAINKFLPGFNPGAAAPGTTPVAPGTTPAPAVNPLDQFRNIFKK
ncbi:hypothetical protein ETAA8_58970 [Anatilimnocola aggregata]|uniref:Uncharacterized protein n=1 Tax=Anatilimnocola aggregata TaxID=2528021 RepID=A0A517YKJ6_9BACT|nr:hypothetical protein [Anatilimnocola aggregata]QDU30749.1 hypothetical protein ETAA8_58970 [Anatilimnocola aggregata]